jgi:hypothetical protein
MVLRLVVGPVAALGICLLFASSAHAQCSKDVDCKGDRVCEEGACVSPPAAAAALPPAPPAPSGAAPVAGAAPAPAAAAAPAAAPAPLAPVASTFVAPPVPTTQRHNSGMMAVGIVMVSIGPIALLAAMVTSFNKADCESYDPIFDASGSSSSRDSNCGRYNTPLYVSLLSGVGLIGAGIPMIVIGGKREPIGTARLTPWASPHGGGLGLRVDL